MPSKSQCLCCGKSLSGPSNLYEVEECGHIHPTCFSNPKVKTLFFPPTYQKYAKIVELKSVSAAKNSVAKLESEMKKAKSRDKKNRIIKVANLAANRVEVMLKKTSLKPETRERLSQVKQIYRDFVDKHKGKYHKAKKKSKNNPKKNATLSTAILTANLVKEYGPKVGSLAKKYGPDVIDYISKYGKDAIKYIAKYGEDGIDMLNEHGKQALKMIPSEENPRSKVGIGSIVKIKGKKYEVVSSHSGKDFADSTAKTLKEVDNINSEVIKRKRGYLVCVPEGVWKKVKEESNKHIRTKKSSIKTYFCPKCNKNHHLNSKVGKKHITTSSTKSSIKKSSVKSDTYYCGYCKKAHRKNSKIGKKHLRKAERDIEKLEEIPMSGGTKVPKSKFERGDKAIHEAYGEVEIWSKNWREGWTDDDGTYVPGYWAYKIRGGVWANESGFLGKKNPIKEEIDESMQDAIDELRKEKNKAIKKYPDMAETYDEDISDLIKIKDELIEGNIKFAKQLIHTLDSVVRDRIPVDVWNWLFPGQLTPSGKKLLSEKEKFKEMANPSKKSINLNKYAQSIEVYDTINNYNRVQHKRADGKGRERFQQLLKKYKYPRYVVQVLNDAGNIIADNQGIDGEIRYFKDNPKKTKTSKKKSKSQR